MVDWDALVAIAPFFPYSSLDYKRKGNHSADFLFQNWTKKAKERSNFINYYSKKRPKRTREVEKRNPHKICLFQNKKKENNTNRLNKSKRKEYAFGWKRHQLSAWGGVGWPRLVKSYLVFAKNEGARNTWTTRNLFSAGVL